MEWDGDEDCSLEAGELLLARVETASRLATTPVTTAAATPVRMVSFRSRRCAGRDRDRVVDGELGRSVSPGLRPALKAERARPDSPATTMTSPKATPAFTTSIVLGKPWIQLRTGWDAA